MTYLGTKTKVTPVGDIVIHHESSIFCYESGKLKNNNVGTSPEVADIAGQPVVEDGADWALVEAGSEATATGIVADNGVLESLATTATSARDYKILRRGPAVLNQDRLPANDYLGAALNIANLVAQLLNSNIISRTESPRSSTQTS